MTTDGFEQAGRKSANDLLFWMSTAMALMVLALTLVIARELWNRLPEARIMNFTLGVLVLSLPVPWLLAYKEYRSAASEPKYALRSLSVVYGAFLLFANIIGMLLQRIPR